jgi:hypothetical protein
MKINKQQLAYRETLRLKLRVYYPSVNRAMSEELTQLGMTVDGTTVSKFFAGDYNRNYYLWLTAASNLLKKGKRQAERTEQKLKEIIS